MKFFIKFQGLKGIYHVVNMPNKTQAIAKVSDFRNDAIAFSEKESVFTPFEAIEFKDKWKEVDLQFLEENCNTRKKFIITLMGVDGKASLQKLVKFRGDELAKFCKKEIHPKGQFFTIGAGGHLKERYFVLNGKKKGNIPLAHIKEVKNFPMALPSSEPVESIKPIEEIRKAEPVDIETEIVK